MIACVDVWYADDGSYATAACVLLSSFEDPPTSGITVRCEGPLQPYAPGALYLRELPCILNVLGRIGDRLETIVVDGYAWLDAGCSCAGLGAHVWHATGVPTIGVAKTEFRGMAAAARILRGRSCRPLFVTSAGTRQDVAAANIISMHGAHRLPDALRMVDALSRRPDGTPAQI